MCACGGLYQEHVSGDHEPSTGRSGVGCGGREGCRGWTWCLGGEHSPSKYEAVVSEGTTLASWVVLTLAVLAVLVAGGDGVHAVAGGAVGGGAVGLRGGQAVHALDGVRALATAGRDGVGALQAAVQGRDGEVVLGLGGDGAGVAQDAHHLGERRGGKNGGCLNLGEKKN